MTDTSFNVRATEFQHPSENLNTARYTRYFAYDHPDAMGRKEQLRGYNDLNLFAAMTEHEKVAFCSMFNILFLLCHIFRSFFISITKSCN